MAILNTCHYRKVLSPSFNCDSTPEAAYNLFYQPHSSPLSRSVHADINFLQPYLSYLRSIVIVGSSIQGTYGSGSDVDIVVISRKSCLEDICEAVFENDIERSFTGENRIKLEVTVLTEGQAQELFSIASPFAFAIRHGRVLYDDGYLETLNHKPNPRVPTKEYYTKSLFENVACQYFAIIKELEKTAGKRDCSFDCCESEESCCSLLPATILPKLIFRMLYLTLPFRGLMPLSKDDVVAFSEAFYPSHLSEAVKTARILTRSRSEVMSFPVYRSLKSASVKLFREILTMFGYSQDVRQIVCDAASSAKGNYNEIESSLLKKCFI